MLTLLPAGPAPPHGVDLSGKWHFYVFVGVITWIYCMAWLVAFTCYYDWLPSYWPLAVSSSGTPSSRGRDCDPKAPSPSARRACSRPPASRCSWFVMVIVALAGGTLPVRRCVTPTSLRRSGSRADGPLRAVKLTSAGLFGVIVLILFAGDMWFGHKDYRDFQAGGQRALRMHARDVCRR